MTLRDIFFYVIGIGFLALAKTKHVLHGYSTPKPFDITDTERCIAYDLHVVEQWLVQLEQFTHHGSFLVGKSVLELGPGSDLGVGILLLASGAREYNACDVNDLAKKAPDRFYEALFERLRDTVSDTRLSFLREQLERARAGLQSKLNFIVSTDFDLASSFEKNSIEIVFSQAAFEHFDDVDATVARLSAVCKSGAVLVAEIDLQTHSRWIRHRDPNNIYRYPASLYRKFSFRGIPNRVRPSEYRSIFERHGWTDITITTLTRYADYGRSLAALSEPFTSESSQMELLSVLLCARKRMEHP
jgi:ubiquinone/menaquinone biosynthesis C-methylase UbiE